MSTTLKRWILGICIGICIPAVFFSARNYMHRNDKYAGIARVVGVDVATWADVNRLYDRASSQHTLSSRDIDQAQTWLSNSNREVRVRALVALRYCTDLSVKPRATALIRTKLSDREPGVRMKAIMMLARVSDPDLTADANMLLNDPVESVRACARDTLTSRVP